MRRNNPLCYQYPTNAQRKGLRTLRGINGQYHFVELISKYINDAKKWHEKSIGEMWTESTAQYLWILLLLPLKNVSLQNSTLLLHPTNWVGFLDNYTCFQKEYMCWMSRLLIEGEQPANSQVSRVVTCAKVNLAPDFSKVKKWRQQRWMNIMKKEERGLTLMYLNWWFEISSIFVPIIVPESLIGMSTVPVKGVLEKQHQEKLK